MADDYLEYQAREKHENAETVTNSSASRAAQEQLLRGLLERQNRVTDSSQDHLQVSSKADRRTQFDELVVGQEQTSFALNAQWDSLEFRNTINTTGSGSVTHTTSGSYKLSTGVQSGSTAELTSNQAGVYEAGTTAVFGMGARLRQTTGSLTASNEVRWGGFDSENGFGYGVDKDGLFVFHRRGSKETKIYRDNWDGDPLDGTGESGLDIDFRDLLIFQVQYTHYGSGKIAWYLAKRAESYDLDTQNRIFLHELDPVSDLPGRGPSVYQPDLPFKMKVDNSGSGDDIGMEVTGRSFRRIDQKGVKQVQSPTETLLDFQNLTQNQYKPVFGITKKDTYKGFPNQVNVRFDNADVVTDQDISVKVEKAQNLIDTGSSTLSEVPQWEDASCVQTAKGGNVVTGSADGKKFIIQEKIYRGVTAQTSNNKSDPDKDNVEVNAPIGRNEDIVVSVRQDSSNTTTISVTANWKEKQ